MIPERIPIQRIEDYHTHHIGMTEDGKQFFGYEFFIAPKDFVYPSGISALDRKKYYRAYVVLYIFDKEGNYLMTNHWSAGVSETDDSITSAKMEQMIYELGNVEFKDILIKPFQTVIDGYIFGLIIDEKLRTVELQPGSAISFHEPWDGEYDT
jgi:hypothetical protein